MPTTILQAAVGAGKTEAALSYLSRTIGDPDKAFAKVWVLLATKRQEIAFRQRLIDLQDGQAVYFNAEIFNFYELNARILNLAGQPQRRINEAARMGLLGQIVREHLAADRLQVFAPIAHTPGFLRVLADLIYELKQNQVFPETFQRAVQTQKDHELVSIYAQYQSTLQTYRLVDLQGEGWLALVSLRDDLSLASDVALLLVDGYDQFTPVQANLLAYLSQRVQEVIITLTKAPGEAHESPQQSIGRRFVAARKRLAKAHAALDVALDVMDLTEPQVPKHADLLVLGRNIFSDVPSQKAAGGLSFIEAPEPQSEVAAVLRKVKSLLLAEIRPEDILIALRDWPRYYTFFVMYQNLYELPLLLHYGQPLANNPAVVVLLNLLKLSDDDPDSPSAFRRRALLDVLRSPYIAAPGFDQDAVALLDRISREKQVLGGRQNWLNAIEWASEEFYDEDGDYYPPLISLEQGSDLSLNLESFFDAVIQPEQSTRLDYVSRLELLIGIDPLQHPDDEAEMLDFHRRNPAHIPQEVYTVDMLHCLRAIHGGQNREAIVNRDAEALNQFKELLRGMLNTEEFLRTALGQQPTRVTWRAFLAEIEASVKHIAPVKRSPIRSGRVLVTTATEARGLPHDHVFILGLAEGIFPAQVTEDPIYLDRERAALSARGVLLETAVERRDDNGLFYELINLPRKSLTLSRPTVQAGKPWVESHLWRMTQAVFHNLQAKTLATGQVVPPDEVASVDEAVLAAADWLNAKQDANQHANQHGVALYHWLTQKYGAYWQRVLEGRRTEAARLSRRPHDSFSGRLQHPGLIDTVQAKLGVQHKWSASQLNDFGLCPFRFFARRFLKLEALDEPHEGLDALQLGSLNHKLLETTYREVMASDLQIVPGYLEDALEIFDEVADDLLVKAPETYGFQQSALWQQEKAVIRRRLQSLIQLDFSPGSPLAHVGAGRVPYAVELKFGYRGTPPVQIPITNTESIFVRGSIDRIDRVGNHLIVVDYKTGSTGISTAAMAQGRNFQMMVYVLALDAILKQNQSDLQIVGGLFWHIRNQQTSGTMHFEEDVLANTDIQEAQKHIAHYLRQGRMGDFVVQPNKIENGRCVRYCEFYQLCRLANTHQYKNRA